MPQGTERLSADLTHRFGRGFSRQKLWQMRAFHLAWPAAHILQTPSGESTAELIRQSPSALATDLPVLAQAFPLPWSAYVRLLSVKNPQARAFYETEALRGGWSVRQLDRQIGSQFYERTALARSKSAMLENGATSKPGDLLTPEQAIKDPFVLEFLNLKDEYSESDLEDALIQHLARFPVRTGRRFHLHRSSEAATHRRQLVPCRSAVFPPSSALPAISDADDRWAVQIATRE